MLVYFLYPEFPMIPEILVHDRQDDYYLSNNFARVSMLLFLVNLLQYYHHDAYKSIMANWNVCE
jgi:hypothetical protein